MSSRRSFGTFRLAALKLFSTLVTCLVLHLAILKSSTMKSFGGRCRTAFKKSVVSSAGVITDWIERQLAHSERDGVRAAYNYAEYLPERRKMMQFWSDYLDDLRAGKADMPVKPSA